MDKIIVAGGRDFDDYSTLCLAIERRIAPQGIVPEIVNGMCPTGADMLARRYADKMGFKIKPFPADWDKYGRRAGPLRNEEMARYGDVLIDFWDGRSPGSRSMIYLALEHDCEVHVYRY